MKKTLKSNRGVILVAALFLIAVFSFLITALLAYTVQQSLNVRNSRAYKDAEYLARSGVEATVKAFQEIDQSNTGFLHPTGDKTLLDLTTNPVYLLNDGSFYTYLPGKVGASNDPYGNTPPKSEDIAGYYTVTVKSGPGETAIINGKIEPVTRFKATAVVGGATTVTNAVPTNTGGMTATKSAYFVSNTVGHTSAIDLGLYDNQGMALPTSEFKLEDVREWGSSTIQYKLYTQTSQNPLAFPQPNPDAPVPFHLKRWVRSISWGDLVGARKPRDTFFSYAAPQIYFDMPIDLRSSYSDTLNIVGLFGTDIVLNQDVHLYLHYTVGKTSSRLGTLLIGLPSDGTNADTYYTDPQDPSVKVGKIYFNGDVYLHARSLFNSKTFTLFPKGTVCYFRMESGKKNDLQYIDLVKFFRDQVGQDSTMFPSFTASDAWVLGMLDNLYASNAQAQKMSYKSTDMRFLNPTLPGSKDEYVHMVPPRSNSSTYVVWE